MLLGSEMLEVAIGLSFLYLLLSVVCSTLTEWMSWLRGLRSRSLEEAVTRLVIGTASGTAPAADEDLRFLGDLIDHPLIDAIKKNGKFPSYIHARTFVGALLATVSGASTTATDLTVLLAPPATGASGPIPEHLRKQLAAILAAADNDVARFRTGVETWFDDAMERVGGWYKRTTQRWTILFAVIVTLLLNANTFVVASGMLNDPTARAVLVASAAQVVASPGPGEATASPASNPPADHASGRRQEPRAARLWARLGGHRPRSPRPRQSGLQARSGPGPSSRLDDHRLRPIDGGAVLVRRGRSPSESPGERNPSQTRRR